jgi:hypothetical protein
MTRADSDVDVVDAWHESFEMSLPTPEYGEIDGARFHRATDTVLLRANATIVSVLDISGTVSGKAEALQQAVDRQFGTRYSDSTEVPQK